MSNGRRLELGPHLHLADGPTITFRSSQTIHLSRALTSRPNMCRKPDYMVLSGQSRHVQFVWLRAALALVMLVMTSLQPGMVAMAKSAMHPGAVVGVAAAGTGQSYESDSHEHGSNSAAQDDETGDAGHHGDPKTADVCCDIHCAPSHAVPVDFPPFPQPSSGVLAMTVSSALMPGETSELIRPPRT